ncbi:MAG: SIS domain-containing protein [Robiginitomaculum sp.]|nr:SIS domain-containing protein [Robiginitomaculum sp.]MDQ7078651.1 SIS domain-containing protein [Robiginitomaculum sp.]
MSNHKQSKIVPTAQTQTLMHQESWQAPACIARQRVANAGVVEALGARLRSAPPALVVTCARGSSNNAASYAKYLIETHIGTPTLSAAPSVNSVYNIHQNMDQVLFLAISQSGQSPDILSAAKAAKAGGALVVCLVNETASPLAQLADIVIPLHAGAECSVAATKTFIGSLSALVHLVAVWGQNADLLVGLKALPTILESTLACDWSAAIPTLISATSLFVVGRGLGLGVAQEAALKFKETCSLHAEAFSAAEVKHGPMTLVKEGFPVLIFSAHDETQPSIDDVASTFIARGARVLSAGHAYEGALTLSTTPCPVAELRPLVFIQSFYNFVNTLALTRGQNPDHPPFLNKVTETL